MSEQTSFPMDDGAPDHAELRAHSVDYTPTLIARQGVVSALGHLSGPIRFLDPSAGSGVFGQQLKKCAGGRIIHSLGMDVREDDNVRRHYGVTWTGKTMGDFLTLAPQPHKWDLILSNIPFHLWTSFVRKALEHVSPTGLVAFLGLSSWGQRSRDGIELFQEFPPFEQWRVGGPVNFRGPGLNPKTGEPWGTDQRCYSFWTWRHPKIHQSPAWRTLDLEALPALARKWKTQPGTELS